MEILLGKPFQPPRGRYHLSRWRSEILQGAGPYDPACHRGDDDWRFLGILFKERDHVITSRDPWSLSPFAAATENFWPKYRNQEKQAASDDDWRSLWILS